MADTVQVLMERMIPELEDLQEKKLFAADEIHQIVEHRREFEYMMRRVPLRKIDGLRYIEYELNLEALRKKRKARLGLVKMSLSDTAGIKRVHAIFDRVLYKHRGNVDLWLQYIEFCKAEGSGRVLSHVFTRALQSHPRSAELWIEAAAFEFSTNLSVDAARVLLQRAIRINKHNQKLWHEYFRLELLYIQKLTVRREILKLDGDTTASGTSTDSGASVLLEELPEEDQDDRDTDEIAAATEQQKSRELILGGAIPRIIYKNAIASMPDDVAFRLQFVELSDLFERRFASDLSQFILQSCMEDFPLSELVHTVQAQRPLITSDADTESVEKQCVALFEQSVTVLKTVTMKEKLVEWIVDRLTSADRTAYLVQYAKTTLKQFAEDAEASTAIVVKYMDFVQRTEGTSSAVAVVHELVTKKEHISSAALWLLYSQLVLHPHSHVDHEKRATKRRRSLDAKHVKKPLDKSITVLKDALKHVNKSDTAGLFAVWQRLIHLLVSDPSSTSAIVESAFQDAIKTQPLGSDTWNALREQYMVWLSASRPVDVVRTKYKAFIENGQLLPTLATQAFLLRCIDFETALPSADTSVDRVRVLYEKLVDLFGSTDDQVWVAYIQFFKDHARFADANKVLHRALRVFKDSLELQQLAV